MQFFRVKREYEEVRAIPQMKLSDLWSFKNMKNPVDKPLRTETSLRLAWALQPFSVER